MRYPRAKSRPDVSGVLNWSPDLRNWHASGQSDGSHTVTFAETVVSGPNADPEIVEATASIAAPGGGGKSLFVSQSGNFMRWVRGQIAPIAGEGAGGRGTETWPSSGPADREGAEGFVETLDVQRYVGDIEGIPEGDRVAQAHGRAKNHGIFDAMRWNIAVALANMFEYTHETNCA